MKHILITIIAAVLVVGCGESQQSESQLTQLSKNLYASKPKADRELMAALRTGSIIGVKQAIDNGANVNTRDDAGWTPLDWTTDLNFPNIVEIAEMLIANGADANTADNNKMTPIHWTAGYGKKELTKLFLEKGADVNAKDSKGRTSLHHAAFRGRKEIAELLITKGADVNAKDDDGKTPLDWAVEEDHTETAALLRKHGGKTKKELEAGN